MPDTITAPVADSTPASAAPAVVAPSPSPAVVLNADGVPGPNVAGNPSTEEARRVLYEKHYGAPPPETPVPTPTPVTPEAPTAVAPPTPAFPPEFMQALQVLQTELAAIKAQTKPVVPEVSTESEPEPGWMSLLREGRIKEAELAFAKVAADLNQNQIVEQAVARAREVAHAESEIDSFVKDLRTANPDLLVMEPYVTAEAQAKLARVQASGSIKTTDDAVREYKKAVIDATESARKMAQQLRGAGKTEAMTRNREVLSASTPTPQQITPRVETSEPEAPVMESPESYFEKRKARESDLKNPYAR